MRLATMIPHNSAIISGAVVLGFLMIAGVLGIVTASGNFVLIGVAVGAVAGITLLSSVGTVIWIVLGGALLISGPIQLFYPQYVRVTWAFSILGLFLLVAAFIHLAARQESRSSSTPGFVYIFLAFMAYCVISSGVLVPDPTALIAGIRRYFQYMGLVLVLSVVAFSTATVDRWLKFLIACALIQLPFALYQSTFLVPQRYNLPRGIVPDDVVAGTFEAQMWGGGNSAGMAYFLILTLVAMTALYRQGQLGLGRYLIAAALMIAPLMLGETKIVVVMLLPAFVLAFIDVLRKRPLLFIFGVIVAAAVTFGLFMFYMGGTRTEAASGWTFERRLQMAWDYNFGDVGYYGGSSLNRTSVYSYWWKHHGMLDPMGTLFGHGLGSAGAYGTGHMDRAHPGMFIGLTTLSAMLWDSGLFGTGLFLASLAGAFVCAQKLIARARDPKDQLLMRVMQVSIVLQSLLLLHSELILAFPSMQVLFAFTLGLIAWTWRRIA